MSNLTRNLYDPRTGLIRVIAAGMGTADVMQGTQRVATIWDTNSDKAAALYIDSGQLTKQASEQVMDRFQRPTATG